MSQRERVAGAWGGGMHVVLQGLGTVVRNSNFIPVAMMINKEQSL